MLLSDPFSQIEELPYLGFCRSEPCPDLSGWVQCYWSVRSRLVKPTHEYLYPDGGSTLLFQFDADTKPQASFNTQQSLLSKQFTNSVNAVGIRFLPGGASALFGIPIAELNQQSINADLLGLPGLKSLYDSLQKTGFAERVRTLQTWLLKLATNIRSESATIAPLRWQWEQADMNMAALVEQTGWSRRRIERLFRQQIGVSPNHLKILQRVKNARYLIKTQPQARLVDVALQAGYFDQAHFNHQFSQVTGYTPGQYQQKQRQRLVDKEMIIRKVRTDSCRAGLIF